MALKGAAVAGTVRSCIRAAGGSLFARELERWARGVVASGAREASPRSPSYKLGGYARGFARPTPSESTNSSALVFRIFFCLKVAPAPNHG